MKALLQRYWLPKLGNSLREYEDAFWPFGEGMMDGKAMRFAIADGATDSICSGRWARSLVLKYCSVSRLDLEVNSESGFRSELQKAARRWSDWVFQVKRLPWHAYPKAQKGAFSSLLGLHLEEHNRWNAFAIGDSCLFQIRDTQLITKGPLEKSSDFGDRPLLLATDPAKRAAIWDGNAYWLQNGDWRVGDSFYLMTDALAHWFLSEREAGRTPWQELSEFETESNSFGDWVAKRRSARELRNDDTTLLIIRII